MKGRVVAFVSVISIASLVAAGVDAKGKPDKPPEDTAEFIAFSGELLGGEAVEGCCPNAGPFPPYQMTVPEDLGNSAGPQVFADTYPGFLFISPYGSGRNTEYLVQFWGVSQSNNHIAIEIIGGVIDEDRKNKATKVVFDSEECVHLNTKEYIDTVTFTLVRTRL